MKTMHLPTRSRRASLVLTPLLVTGMACGDGSTGTPIDPIPRRQLATDLATNVLVPTLDTFVQRATELEAALAAYDAAPTDTAARDAARQAWTAAIDVWQRLEVMQVGPAGASATVAGGLDLRFEIYAWELHNSCRVDGVLAGGTYVDTATLGVQPVDRRGLATIEDLLYYDGTTSRCAGNPTLLSTVVDLGQARASYAHVAGTLVRERAEQLRDAWAEAGGGFLSEVSNAGLTSTVYDTAQAALNAFSDALFYVYEEVADFKLALPAGIAGCAAATCPGDVESTFAGRSIEHVRNNLLAFQQLFLGAAPGTDANGFDDLLVSIGQEQLATTMTNQIASAITLIDAVDGPLEQAVNDDAADVAALYQAIRDLGTNLKTTFVEVLDLQLPSAAAGDND